MTIAESAGAVYLIGIIAGLAVMRDPWPTRVVTAVCWPLGVVAFVVVMAILVIAAAVLWPFAVLGTAAVAGLMWWLARG